MLRKFFATLGSKVYFMDFCKDAHVLMPDISGYIHERVSNKHYHMHAQYHSNAYRCSCFKSSNTFFHSLFKLLAVPVIPSLLYIVVRRNFLIEMYTTESGGLQSSQPVIYYFTKITVTSVHFSLLLSLNTVRSQPLQWKC